MQSQATVVGLQICPGYRKPMTPVESARAVENLGLEGDRHAKGDSKRQVLLIEAETLEKLDLHVGDVKENITTRGIALMSLPIGTRLCVGEAVLEITGECHPCSRMEDLRPGLLQEIGGQRGMLAHVAQTGKLHVGDAITLESPSA
jgi:MOSC domain-containing protein YiiM